MIHRLTIQPYLARVAFPASVYDLRRSAEVVWDEPRANPVTIYRQRGKTVGSAGSEEVSPWYWTYWGDTIYRLHRDQVAEILEEFPPESETSLVQDYPSVWGAD